MTALKSNDPYLYLTKDPELTYYSPISLVMSIQDNSIKKDEELSLKPAFSTDLLPSRQAKDYFFNEKTVDEGKEPPLSEFAKLDHSKHLAAVREAFKGEYGLTHPKI